MSGIKLKVLPQFPAKLVGGIGIDLTKLNGVYTVDLDYTEFGTTPSVPAGSYALAFDPATNSYVLVATASLGGGIPDAPNDGALYGRKNLAWSVALADAPTDGTTYGRKNAAWVAVGGGGGGTTVYVSDTPPAGAADSSLWWESDTGILYIRYNDGNSAQWVAVSTASGGDLSTTVRMVGNDNVIGGRAAGAALTTGMQNTVVGAEAGASLTADTGHTLVGYQAGKACASGLQTWNTFIGHASGRMIVAGGSNVAVGRAAVCYDTDGRYITAVGHAAYFMGLHGDGVIAIGDTAAGAPVDGTGTNWGGTGQVYYGSINDISCSYLGRQTGKATVDARSNAHAIGTLARIPKRDNVMVLGHGAGFAVETSGQLWNGWTRIDVSQNAAMTLTAAALVSGMIVRSGTLSSGVTDVTDTAANIVAAGPGANCELPCSMEISFGNVTGQTVTVSGGAGVSVSTLGLQGAVASGVLAKFRLVIANSTPGSESVVIYRVG